MCTCSKHKLKSGQKPSLTHLLPLNLSWYLQHRTELLAFTNNHFSSVTYQDADEPELSFVALHKPRGMGTQGSVWNEEADTRSKSESYQEHQGWEEASRTKNINTQHAYFQWCLNALIHSFSVCWLKVNQPLIKVITTWSLHFNILVLYSVHHKVIIFLAATDFFISWQWCYYKPFMWPWLWKQTKARSLTVFMKRGTAPVLPVEENQHGTAATLGDLRLQ